MTTGNGTTVTKDQDRGTTTAGTETGTGKGIARGSGRMRKIEGERRIRIGHRRSESVDSEGWGERHDNGRMKQADS